MENVGDPGIRWEIWNNVGNSDEPWKTLGILEYLGKTRNIVENSEKTLENAGDPGIPWEITKNLPKPWEHVCLKPNFTVLQ